MLSPGIVAKRKGLGKGDKEKFADFQGTSNGEPPEEWSLSTNGFTSWQKEDSQDPVSKKMIGDPIALGYG